MSQQLQEWKSYSSHGGGVNNLAVCKLNQPGQGAMFLAVGTSTKGMPQAVRNAYRNLKRSEQRRAHNANELAKNWNH